MPLNRLVLFIVVEDISLARRYLASSTISLTPEALIVAHRPCCRRRLNLYFGGGSDGRNGRETGDVTDTVFTLDDEDDCCRAHGSIHSINMCSFVRKPDQNLTSRTCTFATLRGSPGASFGRSEIPVLSWPVLLVLRTVKPPSFKHYNIRTLWLMLLRPRTRPARARSERTTSFDSRARQTVGQNRLHRLIR
jgi:hypothetical protein